MGNSACRGRLCSPNPWLGLGDGGGAESLGENIHCHCLPEEQSEQPEEELLWATARSDSDYYLSSQSQVDRAPPPPAGLSRFYWGPSLGLALIPRPSLG